MYFLANLDNQNECWSSILLNQDWSLIKTISLSLIFIYLGECQINDDNIKILINLKWPHLAILDLSNICQIQMKIN